VLKSHLGNLTPISYISQLSSFERLKHNMPVIIKAATTDQYNSGGYLFKEYADSLDFTLSFQNFEEELMTIPVMYGPPKGALFLVEIHGVFVGVAGLRQIQDEYTCEVKRMYIKPDFREKGIGKMLLRALIEEAKNLEYRLIKLDTLGYKMPAAVALYTSFGFTETSPYNYNPHEGVVYFEKNLTFPN
jgi:putative acetyltransferase